jgi:hypothetical protein
LLETTSLLLGLGYAIVLIVCPGVDVPMWEPAPLGFEVPKFRHSRGGR